MISFNWAQKVPMWIWTVFLLGVIGSSVALAADIIRPDVNDFTAEADGVVYMVETKQSGKKNSHTSYVTHVRFTNSDHQTFEAQSIVNGDWRRHEEGDEVVVRYNPRDPEAGCLIKGDEDKLGGFDAFIDGCRYGGLVALVVSIVALIVVGLRKDEASIK